MFSSFRRRFLGVSVLSTASSYVDLKEPRDLELTVVVDPAPGFVTVVSFVVVTVDPGPFFVIVVVDPGPVLVTYDKFSMSLHVVELLVTALRLGHLITALRQSSVRQGPEVSNLQWWLIQRQASSLWFLSWLSRWILGRSL